MLIRTIKLVYLCVVPAMVLFASSLSGAQGYTHQVHRSGANGVAFPGTVLLSKPEVQVRELTAAGALEKVPQWAEQASRGEVFWINLWQAICNENPDLLSLVYYEIICVCFYNSVVVGQTN